MRYHNTPQRTYVFLLGLCLTTGWLGLAAVSLARAQDETQPIIRQVRLQGNHVISATSLLGKIQTRAGEYFAPLILNEDIKRLHKTGYFEDVEARVIDVPGAVDVLFIVVEKPLYHQMQWQGNRRLSLEKLEKLVKVETGEFLDERKLDSGMHSVREEYEKKGYPNAIVDYTVRKDAVTDDATVFVVVDEGRRVKIKRIEIDNNDNFSDRKVRKAMKTKRWRWFRSGKYKRQQLHDDEQRVAAFYRQEGYQDVQVASGTSLAPNGKHMTVRMDVNEGPKYTVADVQLVGNTIFPTVDIMDELAMVSGKPYHGGGVQEDTRTIQSYYFDRGYIFADIAPEPSIDPETQRVLVTYRITENELGYVERVDIRGNLNTRDIVVRREIRVRPGDPFLGAQLKRSRERLMNLGYFEQVDFDSEPGSQPTHRNLVVNVTEQKTGQFSFGGGFSSVDRLLGFVEVQQRNFDWRNWPQFTGAGQHMLVRMEIGTIRQNYELSFTEPWWFGKNISFGIDAFNRTVSQNRSLGFGFDQESRGVAFRFGHEFTEFVHGSLRYGVRSVEISDIPPEASVALRAEEGKNTISTLGVSITRDSRDSTLDPKEGTVLSVGGDLAGGALAGDKDFYRLSAAASHYIPHIKDRFVLELHAKTGIVESYGDSATVPIFERYFGSGTNLIRGFRERRIGPLDPLSNDPVGGETMAIANIDWVFPIAESIKGSVFLDVGNVWETVGDYAEEFESGFGIGARVKTPLGPMRLDLGFPLTKVKDEKQKPRFHFNISRGF